MLRKIVFNGASLIAVVGSILSFVIYTQAQCPANCTKNCIDWPCWQFWQNGNQSTCIWYSDLMWAVSFVLATIQGWQRSNFAEKAAINACQVDVYTQTMAKTKDTALMCQNVSPAWTTNATGGTCGPAGVNVDLYLSNSCMLQCVPCLANKGQELTDGGICGKGRMYLGSIASLKCTKS